MRFPANGCVDAVRSTRRTELRLQACFLHVGFLRRNRVIVGLKSPVVVRFFDVKFPVTPRHDVSNGAGDNCPEKVGVSVCRGGDWMMIYWQTNASSR